MRVYHSATRPDGQCKPVSGSHKRPDYTYRRSTRRSNVGLADEFEDRLERMVEGFFARAFKSRLQPAEIGHRLLREQESGKSVSVGAVYVPNHYQVNLSPKEHAQLEGLTEQLSQEFRQLLQENAAENKWKLPGPLEVSFGADPDVKEGRFQIVASHRAAPEVIEAKPGAQLRVVEGRETWKLTSEEITIGRLPECHVALADPEVSRRHAQLQKRQDGWWVLDLHSTNDTYVNGQIVKERRLEAGDVVTVGSTQLVFEESDT